MTYGGKELAASFRTVRDNTFKIAEDIPAEVIALLRSEGDKFAAFLVSQPDAFLAETVRMPPTAAPATTSRFEMMLSPKKHEMHHRGQLMMLQRLIGLVPHLTRQLQERMAAARR